MNSNDPNIVMLDIVAERLGDDLCESLVFVGGAVAGLLITDPAQPAIRPTEDVDLLAQVVARQEYYGLEAQLRAEASSRTCALTRRFAAGLSQASPSMSCRRCRTCWDSAIAGIRSPQQRLGFLRCLAGGPPGDICGCLRGDQAGGVRRQRPR